MTRDIFSNHIGGASELTVFASLKPSFAPCRTLISYPARLRIHLRMLSALRRIGLEGRRAGVYSGPLDALRTLQYIRWTLIDNDTRMLLAVNFDRPLEPYLRRIVDIAGPLLDTILCHCEGFEGHSSDQGFHKFMEFANAHQAPVELFAASSPNLTVDDGDYFIQGDRDVRKEKQSAHSSANPRPDATEQMLAELKFQLPEEKLRESAVNDRLALLDQGLSIVQTLYENAHLFIDDAPERRDDLLYYRLLERLTPGFWRSLHSSFDEDNSKIKLRDPYNITADELARLNQLIKETYKLVEGHIRSAPDVGALDPKLQMLHLLNRYQEALDWYADMPEPREQKIQSPPAFEKSDIQYGLLESSAVLQNTPQDHTAACLMLLRVDDAQRGRDFLKKMETELWPSDGGSSQCNLSITYAGLNALNIHESVRQQLPTAFRQGMAARAGMLGDVDVNNPEEWVWPKSNWISVNGAVNPGGGAAVLPGTIDIVITLAKPHHEEVADFSNTHPLFADVSRIAAMAGPGVALIAVEPMQSKRVGPERKVVQGHLGFQDGISQPRFRKPQEAENGDYEVHNSARFDADIRKGEKQRDLTLLGDLFLGHPAKADLDFSKCPKVREQNTEIKPYPDYAGTPLQNGTFQVIRKLRIDSDAFAKLECHTQQNGRPTVGEMMIGRKRSGSPLIGSMTNQGHNGFNYAADSKGMTVPLQSHIRRANPREADTPRILRRGFSYGPFDDPKADRGLMFIAYNANIAEQFEVIQRWVSGGNSSGISSYHGDPLLAPQRPESTRTFRHFENNKVVYTQTPKTPPVVLQWGLYAFTPSRAGLKMLAENNESPVQQLTPVPPTDRLTSIERDASRDRWKLALEDIDDVRREDRIKIWKEVRDEGGATRAHNYAVLVGSADGVRQVLENPDNALSVREYWNRMTDSTGVLYLGYDAPPVATRSTGQYDKDLDARYRYAVGPSAYTDESKPVNEFLNSRDAAIWFDQAYEMAKDILNALPVDHRYLPKEDPQAVNRVLAGRRVVSERFFHDLIAKLCAKWLGMPGDKNGVQIGGPQGAGPHCPTDLIRASFYVFWPHPSEATQQDSRNRSAALRDAVRAYVKTNPVGIHDTLMGRLMALNPNASAAQMDRIADTVVGVCSGYAGPTAGSLRSVLYDWITTGLLWRLQQRVQLLNQPPTYANMREILEPAILNSMAKRAAPDMLHREAVKDTKIGNCPVKAGEKVVFSLRSATEDETSRPGANKTEVQRYFLFGGDYNNTGQEQPMHACPGQTMALCTMIGAFAAVMRFGDIRPEGPLSFRIR